MKKKKLKAQLIQNSFLKENYFYALTNYDEEIVQEIAPPNFPFLDEISAGVNSTEIEREEERENINVEYSIKGPSSSSSSSENYSIDRNEIGREPVVYVGQFRCSYASIVVQCGEREEREEKEQVKVEIKSVDGVGEERRIKHYSSRHKILLVGEGDFSFSACLAVAFGSSATNIIATSLDSIAFLKENYGRAMSNIAELRSRGSKTMHEIDATEIANHELLRRLQFDRIIFNFPFAGFFPYLSPECQLRCHRNLVNLFLKNAKELLSENGEIHVSHKTNGRYHAEFELENIAASHGLGLIDVVKFKCSDYPGYNTKYGFGGDKNFNCYPSNTFKFGLRASPTINSNSNLLVEEIIGWD